MHPGYHPPPPSPAEHYQMQLQMQGHAYPPMGYHPAPGYPGVPAPGYGVPHLGYGAPAPGYPAPQGAQAPGYAAPQGAPAPGYPAPQGAPALGYAAPQGAPALGYVAPQGFHSPPPGGAPPPQGFHSAPPQGFHGPPPGTPPPSAPSRPVQTGGKGKGKSGVDDIDDSQVKLAITDVVTKVLPMETEYDTEKLMDKLWMMLWKAKKSLNFDGGSQTWKELVTEYADKVYGSLWSSFGDRKWIEQLDFTHVVGAAVQTYFPASMNASVSPIDFADVLTSVSEAANDYARYYYNAPDIIKKHVEGKATSKKVFKALEESREEVVQKGPLDVSTYVEEWAKACVKRFAAENSHPSDVIDRQNCTRLFDELCTTGNCIPLTIQKVSGVLLEPGSEEVVNAINEAYEPYGAVPSYEAKAKKSYGGNWNGGGAGGGAGWNGKGFGGCCGWGPKGGGYGGDMKGKMMLMAMKGKMIAKGDGMNMGKGDGFDGGWSPY